jgi:hypothetical protein
VSRQQKTICWPFPEPLTDSNRRPALHEEGPYVQAGCEADDIDSTGRLDPWEPSRRLVTTTSEAILVPRNSRHGLEKIAFFGAGGRSMPKAPTSLAVSPARTPHAGGSPRASPELRAVGVQAEAGEPNLEQASEHQPNTVTGYLAPRCPPESRRLARQ